MEDCLSCVIFGDLEGLARSYAQQAFEVLAPWTRGLFNAFIGVWFAWMLAVRGALLGQLDVRSFLGQILVFALVGGILNMPIWYFEWIYEPAISTMSGLTQMLVAVPATGVSDASFKGLLFTVEDEVWQVVGLANAVWADGGLRSFHLYPLGALILLPFIFVLFLFLAYLLEGLFKLLAISTLGPLFITAAAFKPTRGFTMSAVRVALNGILTVVFAGIAMGFTLSVLAGAIADLPLEAVGDKLTFRGDAATWVASRDFWMLVVIGLLSILFHLKAATLASNVSGAIDGPGAAGVVAGLGTAAVGVGMRTLSRAGGAAGGATGGAASGTLRHGKEHLLQRFTDRRPGGPQ